MNAVTFLSGILRLIPCKEKFSDAVGKNPERSSLYVNLIIMARSLEQIIYLIESITEDITYVAEAKDIRHPNNRLVVEKE